MMFPFIEQLAEVVRLEPVLVRKLIESAILAAVVVLLRWFSLRLVDKHIAEVHRHYRWRRTFNYTFGLLAVLLIGRVWLDGLREIGVFLGLASAGIAIALRDPLMSLAAWLFILVRRPFAVGDRIELSGHVGDVIDIRMFQTLLLECGKWIDGDQATGRVVYVPNGAVFNNPIANYTDGFEYLWDELTVRVTFESNWRKAKEIIQKVSNEKAAPIIQDARVQLQQAANTHCIVFQKLTPIVYTSVRDFGVQFSVRYLTPTRGRRAMAEEIWEGILEQFDAAPDINFAYTTTRVFQHAVEGKPAMLPEILYTPAKKTYP